jgi:hypothetical protein
MRGTLEESLRTFLQTKYSILEISAVWHIVIHIGWFLPPTSVL